MLLQFVIIQTLFGWNTYILSDGFPISTDTHIIVKVSKIVNVSEILSSLPSSSFGFLLRLVMHFQKNITPGTSYYILNCITNKIYPLNSWQYSVTYEKSCYLIQDFRSHFHRQIHNRLLVQCQPCPIWPPVLPLNLAHIAAPLATIGNEPALLRLLTFYRSNLMSIFGCLGSYGKSVQARGSV
jgi:hypothetical protein